MAYKVLLIPINMPQNKEETYKLWERNWRLSIRVLVFLSSFLYFLYVYTFSPN
jgi:hypothetical protein